MLSPRGPRLRRLANLFLVVFALDALVSVLDDSLGRLGVEALDAPRSGVAALAILLALPSFMLLGLDATLPRRVLLPPVLFVIWTALGALPFSAVYEIEPLSYGLALAQLGLAVVAFVGVRRSNAGVGWLLSERPARRAFDGGHLMRFAATTAIVAPLAIAVLAISSAALWLSAQTNEFLYVGPGGLYAQERTYVKRDKTVHLIAMAHVGDASFYRDVMASIPRENTLVLAEGVSDRQGLLTDFPSPAEFGALAAHVGLTAQAEVSLEEAPTQQSSDIDVSELSEETTRFLNAIGRAIRAETLREGFALYMAYVETVDPARVNEILREIVEVRNRHVLDELRASLDTHDRFVLPWGALHMPGLEQGLLALGFEPETTRDRPLIAFW